MRPLSGYKKEDFSSDSFVPVHQITLRLNTEDTNPENICSDRFSQRNRKWCVRSKAFRAHDMKVYAVVWVLLYSFLTVALDGG
jgi:hypothetical protein